MRVVTILFCSILVSCVQLQVLFSSSHVSEQVPDYRELRIDYLLAFEKQMSIDYTALHKLVGRTQLALDQGKLTTAQQAEVRRWQHKLRSYISFAMLAMPKQEKEALEATMGFGDVGLDNAMFAAEKKIMGDEQVRGLAALILDRLRTADITHINAEPSNDAFYQQVKDDQHDNEKVSQQAKDNFKQALVSKSLELTEKSIRKYYRLLPFAQQGYAVICKEVASSNCQHLQMHSSSDDFKEPPFASIEAVTAEVNKTIAKLNTIITKLSRLKATVEVLFIFKETNFDNLAVMRLYHDYEMTLFNAAQRGFLPLMLAPTFRARAGNIYLQYKGGLDFLQRLGLKKDIVYEPGDIKNPLLTEASHAVIRQSINEMQRITIVRWGKLRDLKSKNKKLADKELYRWSINNEVATAQVVLQDPHHSVVVNHLLNRFQYENRDPKVLRVIRGITEIAEISSVVFIFGGSAIFTAIFPPLAGFGLVGKAIIVATAANFVWAGMAGANTALTHRRWIQIEQALLTGSSERYEDSLKMLREFHKTRRNAIVAGTIGLPLSVPSIKYALNHMYEGSKTMMIDMVAGIFSAREEFGYEGLSDSAVHEGH